MITDHPPNMDFPGNNFLHRVDRWVKAEDANQGAVGPGELMWHG